MPRKNRAETVDATLTARGRTHGDFAACAACSQSILRAMRAGPSWGRLSDVQIEALQMISHKLHRIACGDPDHADHWHDIAGFATLVERWLESNKDAK